MASTYLTRTSVTPTNAQKGTISLWVKRTGLSSTSKGRFFMNHLNSTSYGYTDFTGGDKLRCAIDDPSTVSIQTNRLFRDTSAWYHIVWSIDTTENTASDRVKLYVNGVQETSFQVATYPNQNITLNLFNTSVSNGQVIGSYYTGSSYSGAFEGLISHYNFIDGTAYPASAFGETDTTTGQWKINTSPSVTYGNNGFFILKNGNSLTDQSGEGNDFTLGAGTLTDTKDCPDNVFATLNSLNSWGNTVLTNGNLTAGNTGTSAGHVSSTMHMNSGKWYMEFNVDTHLTSYSAPVFLLAGTGAFQQAQVGFNSSGDGSFGIASNGRSVTDGADSGSVVIPALVNNDKVQIAYDADAGKAWFGINGTYLNSGNPSTGANPYFTSTKLQNNDVAFILIGYDGNAMSANFGNGYFGTSAVADNSTATASTPGTFNYDVPTGYEPLTTKGLNA